MTACEWTRTVLSMTAQGLTPSPWHTRNKLSDYLLQLGLAHMGRVTGP
jgi:hypothetical protein